MPMPSAERSRSQDISGRASGSAEKSEASRAHADARRAALLQAAALRRIGSKRLGDLPKLLGGQSAISVA